LRETKSASVTVSQSRRLAYTRTQNGLPTSTPPERALETQDLRGQITSRLGECAVNRIRQRSQGTNCRQGEQDQQQRVFRQVLTFLFFPQPY